MPKPRVVIVIDLDDTLIETQRLRHWRTRLVKKLSQSAREINIGLGKAVPDPFNIEIFAKRVFPQDKIRAQKLARELNKHLAQSKKYLYPGVTAFLNDLSRKYSLILLTYGDAVLQNKKISHAALSRYFSKVIITSQHSKKGALIKLKKRYGNKLLFIDNSPAAVTLAQRIGINAIRVRNSYKDRRYYQLLRKKIESRV